jgi:hypothetical protein
MIEVHRGAGGLVPLLGILSALLMNVVTVKVFGDSYYQEHRWPKLAVLLLAGAGCLVSGALIRKKRLRESQAEREHIDSLSPASGAVKKILYSGPRDHLMFIPLQYWSIVYFAAALIYGIAGG